MPKKSSDTNKPRPPVTAYNLFVRTCRDELRRKHPQLTVEYNVISRKCSERWKVMSDQEKKRFNDTAESQRKRYKEDLANYVQTQTVKQESATSSILLQTPATQYLPEPVSSPLIKQEQQPQQQQRTLIMPIVTPLVNNPGMINLGKKPAKKRERKQKDPLAPKKPLSAYFLFCADERPKVQSSQAGMPVSDIARELGARWKIAPVELKTRYEQIAADNKHTYQTEMANYKHQTSTNSSPPKTPQTPLNSHEYQSGYSIVSLPSQQHPQLQQLLLQQQNFNSFDHSDLLEAPGEFDLMAADNAIDDDED